MPARARKQNASQHATPSRSAENQELVEAVELGAPELLDLCAGFMAEAGLPPERVSALLRDAAERVRLRRPTVLAERRGTALQLSQATAHWRRDPAYLDSDGAPAAIPESGPAPSIQALLESYVDAAGHEQARRALCRSTVIERDGRVRLVNTNVRVRGHEGVNRLQISVAGLMKTFLENQTSDVPVITKNFDSTAAVGSIPASRVPEIRARVRKILQTAVADADLVLSKYQDPSAPGPISEVGVTVYMYDLPQPSEHGPKTSNGSAPRTRGRKSR